MAVCARCHRATTTFPQAGGLVQLCLTCVGTTAPLCAPFAHDWRGSHQGGTWVCLRCLSTLPSQAISTAPVSADGPTMMHS